MTATSAEVIGHTRNKCGALTKKLTRATWQTSVLEPETQTNAAGIKSSRRSFGGQRLYGIENPSVAFPHYLQNTESWRRKSLRARPYNEPICDDDVNQMELETPKRDLRGETACGSSPSNTGISKTDLPAVEIENPFQSSDSKHTLKFPLIFYSSNYRCIDHPFETHNCETNGEKPASIQLKGNISSKEMLLNGADVKRWCKRDQLKGRELSSTRISCQNLISSSHNEYGFDEPILVSRLTYPPPASVLSSQSSLSCISLFSDADVGKSQDDTGALEYENESRTLDYTSSLPPPKTLNKKWRHFQTKVNSAIYGEPVKSPRSILLPDGKYKFSRSKRRSSRCSDKPHIYHYVTANGEPRGESQVLSKFSKSHTAFLGLEANGTVIEFQEDEGSDELTAFRPKSPAHWVEANLLQLSDESMVEESGEMAKTNEAKKMYECSNRILSNSEPSKERGENSQKYFLKLREKPQDCKISQINGRGNATEPIINGQVVIISRLRCGKGGRATRKRVKVGSRGGFQVRNLKTGMKPPCKSMNRLRKTEFPNGGDTGDHAFVSDIQYESFGRYRSRSWEFLNHKVRAAKRSLSWSNFPKLDSRRGAGGSAVTGQKCEPADFKEWLQDVSAFNCFVDKCYNYPSPCPNICSCSPPDDCCSDNQWQTFTFNCTPSNHLTGCACRGTMLLQSDYKNLTVIPACVPPQKTQFQDDCGQLNCNNCQILPCPVIPACPCPRRPPPVPPPPVPEKRPPPRPPKRRHPVPPPPAVVYPPPGSPHTPPMKPPSGHPPVDSSPPPLLSPPLDHPLGYPPPICSPPSPPPRCIPSSISCCRAGKAIRRNLDMIRARRNVQPTCGNRQMVCCAPLCCCPPSGTGFHPNSRRKRKLKTK